MGGGMQPPMQPQVQQPGQYQPPATVSDMVSAQPAQAYPGAWGIPPGTTLTDRQKSSFEAMASLAGNDPNHPQYLGPGNLAENYAMARSLYGMK